MNTADRKPDFLYISFVNTPGFTVYAVTFFCV